MKNLILGFLVFITTFLNAQSVDPETFPTVVGAISNKNVYTNTGGEGKISVQSIIDSAKLISGDFIPLSGTTVGNPLIGAVIQRNDADTYQIFEDDFSNSEIGRIVNTGSSGVTYKSQGGGIDTDFTNGRIATTALIFEINTEISSYGGRGMSSGEDYSPNITDLDYTQKIYVDTKVAKIGADDIEITDFNKGIILTSPNSSRYRITVDNSGNLITTLIP